MAAACDRHATPHDRHATSASQPPATVTRPQAQQLHMERIRTVVSAHQNLLYAVFAHYAVWTGPQRGDSFITWSMAKFLTFCEEVELIDNSADSGCRKEDLENLFISTVQV